ncbi:uncharacterized protein LOC144910065 isoform X2 [Branchiostoma floridae x Branchiostoma belcheri]
MPMPTPGLQKEFTGEMDKHLLSFIIECPSFTRHSLTRWTNSTIYRRTKTAVNFAKSILRCRLQQEFTTPSCGRIGVCMRVFHARKISIECSSIVAWVPSESVTATGKFGWHPG